MPTNWAHNITFGAARYHEPASVADLQAVVAGASRVRALGTGHSFNRIADTTGDLVSLRQLPPVIEVDTAARQVRVGGGVRYGELGAALQAAGLALPNTGSLPHISVAGACATGTHGSGVDNVILAARVSAQTVVGPDGDLYDVSRAADPAVFDGSVLALGRLGVVTELTVDVVPTFDIAQTVVMDVSDDAVAEHIEAILSAAYSVSLFTTWEPDHTRVWVKEQVGRAGGWTGEQTWGGWLATEPQHPVAGMAADHATQQLGVPGPWNARLPHFRLEFTPSAGEELQSEYLLPFGSASVAWQRVSALGERLRPILLAGEVRAIAGDPMWLSTTGGERSVAFHFTWVDDLERVEPVLREVEEALLPLGARPHWGKVFACSSAEVGALYPRLGEFRDLVGRRDPEGVFGNELVDGWLGIDK